MLFMCRDETNWFIFQVLLEDVRKGFHDVCEEYKTLKTELKGCKESKEYVEIELQSTKESLETLEDQFISLSRTLDETELARTDLEQDLFDLGHRNIFSHFIIDNI